MLYIWTSLLPTSWYRYSKFYLYVTGLNNVLGWCVITISCAYKFCVCTSGFNILSSVFVPSVCLVLLSLLCNHLFTTYSICSVKVNFLFFFLCLTEKHGDSHHRNGKKALFDKPSFVAEGRDGTGGALKCNRTHLLLNAAQMMGEKFPMPHDGQFMAW